MKKFLLVPIFASSLLFAQDALKMLEDGTLEQKINAMHQMGYAGNKKGFWYFVKFLSYSQKEDDSSIIVQCRAAAAEALGRIEDERGVDFLLNRYAAEKNDFVKTKILFALSFYKNDKIAEILKSALASEKEEIVFQALLTSSTQKNSKLSPEIEKIKTTSDKPAIRCTAAYALLMLGQNRSENLIILKESLKNEDPEARYWAARQIRSCGAFDALPEVIKASEIENRYWVASELDLTLSNLYYKRREFIEKKRSERNGFILQSTNDEKQQGSLEKNEVPKDDSPK